MQPELLYPRRSRFAPIFSKIEVKDVEHLLLYAAAPLSLISYNHILIRSCLIVNEDANPKNVILWEKENNHKKICKIQLISPSKHKKHVYAGSLQAIDGGVIEKVYSLPVRIFRNGLPAGGPARKTIGGIL